MSVFSLFNVVAICALVSLCFENSSADELNGVVVVFRHGDRTPIRPYPTDPYGNRSLWPVDYGMLTNIGKMNHFKLGQWLRQRYSQFLPEVYSERDIYVRSTDVDRTLMSASANLAGLYPPVKTDIWNPDLQWQPIPIHTIPESMDPVLAAKKECPKFNRLEKELFKTQYFKNLSHQLHDLYAYVTKYSGDSIHDLKSLEYLYSTLFIESNYNFTLPEWAKGVFPDKLKPWASLSFVVPTWTEEMARLKTGPFFNELIGYFRNRTQKNVQYYAPKFLMYSAHDTTIANLLNTMEAFEPHPPPYTATIIFELWRTQNGTDFVQTFYKNTTEPRQFAAKGCNLNCLLPDFESKLKSISIPLDQWESECQSGWPFIYYLMLGGMVSTILCISCIVSLAVYRLKRKSELYMQLPNEEYYA